MAKPVLAIITDAIRYDNHHPLGYFSRIRPVHFYRQAPYGDLKKKDLKKAIKYEDLKDLEEKLLKLRPDIIQGAEPYGSKIQLKLCYLAQKISRKLKIPLIFPMLENRPNNMRFGPLIGPLMRLVLKKYAQKASLIFYLNSGARKNLLEAGVGPKKMKRFLYGIWGVDTYLFRPNLPTPLTLNAIPYILFVGRLDEAKGISYLLEAWERIQGEFPKVELVFIGNGKWGNRVKNKEGIRMKYKGQMKTQDLPPYYANALFTLYPSVTLKRWEEQVGMVNLQSLACGTPVVTTESGAIPEYINSKVGILVPERDSNALAEAMRKLLKDEKLRKKLGHAGRKYILENFDAKKTVGKVEKVLLVLLKHYN